MNMINFIDVVCFGEVRQVVRCFIGYGVWVMEVMGQFIDVF